MKTLKYSLFILMCLTSTLVSAQITRVSGTVSDEFGELPGVAVKEIDAANRTISATVTDGNGNFTMTLKDSKKNKLVFSCVGMKPQVIKPITKQVYKITMGADVKVMKEAVVTAKKMAKSTGLAIPEREVSYASQGLDAKEFEGLGITSVDEALQGRIAGLDIVANSGNLGSGTQMRLRGISTISELTSNEPLIVVNGDVLTDVDMDTFDPATATDESFADLLKVNVEDIQEIKVLKDASATAIWGKDGANGVIEITTKRGKRGPAHVSYTGKVTIGDKYRPVKMLNGDQYTMMVKEAFLNPRLNYADADIAEISYKYGGYQGGRPYNEGYMYDNNTNWSDLVSQYHVNQDHYIGVTGGDEKTTFRVSGGYVHEKGLVIKQTMNRLSTRMNLDYIVSERIKIKSDFSMTYTTRNQIYGNTWGNALIKMPNLSPYYEYENGVASGDYYYMLSDAGYDDTRKVKDPLAAQKSLVNPLAQVNLGMLKERSYNLLPKLELEYKLLSMNDEGHQLNYNGVFYVNVNNNYTDSDDPRDLYTGNYLNLNSASASSGKTFSFTTRHTLTYMPYFKNKDHYMTMLGRFELTSGNGSTQYTAANRLPNGITSPSAGGYIQSMSSTYSQWRGLMYMYSGHYSFKSKYSLDGNLRMDGTTKFGPSKRWLASYSVSGRWNIIDENFMEWAREKAKMSMLGVSGGWGRVGNARMADYLYMNTYSQGLNYIGQSSMRSNGLKLNEIGPEHKTQWNIGFNVGFFDDRIKLRLDVYNALTTNMLLDSSPIPSSTGYGALSYRNVGDMRNKGWEFNINGDRLLKKGKFSLDFYINFANNHNEIVSMDELLLETRYQRDFSRKNRETLQRVQLNHPFGSIYGFRSKGVYQYNYSTAEKVVKGKVQLGGYSNLQDMIDAGMTFPIALNADGKVIYDDKGMPIPMYFCYNSETGKGLTQFNGGDAMYEDVNHDGQIDELDIVYLGNSLPKLTGGFGFTLNYGHWRLATQFNYRYDYDVYNLARLDVESMNTVLNQSEAANYRWRKEGDITTIPRAFIDALGTNYNTLISDRFIEDASFLRLNYIQLSYAFDSKLIKKWHLNQLKLYASARNLFCLTKYTGLDPEVSYGGMSISTDNAKTPGHARSYTFGVNIEF